MNCEAYIEKTFISHSHGGWEVQDQSITKSNDEDFPKAPHQIIITQDGA